MKNFSYILCFLCFTLPAFAQGDVTFTSDDAIGLDVSFQIGGIRTPEALSGMFGFGARAGYYLGSIVFLDGEILYKPNGWEEHNSHIPTDQMIILGGGRFEIISDDMIGIFAKARAGAFRFHSEFSLLEPAKDIYPVVDIGIIIERYFKRNFFLRFDIGDYIIPFGDAKAHDIYGEEYRMGTRHNFAVGFGLGFRF